MYDFLVLKSTFSNFFYVKNSLEYANFTCNYLIEKLLVSGTEIVLQSGIYNRISALRILHELL